MSINKLTSIVLGRYVKQNVPSVPEIPSPLRQYLSDEFQSIEVNLQESADANLQVADVQPERPRKGMMRYAVSPWNPLNNGTQGLVVYNGSAWEAVQGSGGGGGGGPTDAIQDTDFTTNGLMKRTGNGTYTSVTDNSNAWDTAYGWGNHGSAGYLTSFTESDPVFTAHAASGVTATKITNWDTAYGWGDHGSAGYLTSIVDLSITSAKLGYGAVTNTKIANNTISTGQMQDNIVTTAKIVNQAVTGAKIGTNTIDSGNMANNSIYTAAIADGQVTAAKLADSYLTSIADGSITTAKLGSQAVTGAKIAVNTISSGNMANNSIYTAAIADGQVTTAKLADSYLTSIAAGSVGTSELANGAVTNTKIASGAVSNSQLAGSISGNKILTSTSIELENATTPPFVSGSTAYSGASILYKVEKSNYSGTMYDHGGIGTTQRGYADSRYTYMSQGDIAVGVFGIFSGTGTGHSYFQPLTTSGGNHQGKMYLGTSNAKWNTVYASTSSINTSDRTTKQQIEVISDAEARVATAAKGLMRKFKFNDSVEEKGEDARIHFGIIAQDLQDAFSAEGLDASKYAMFCSDTWWEHEGKTYNFQEDAPEDAVEITQLGVRYSELLAFIIATL